MKLNFRKIINNKTKKVGQISVLLIATFLIGGVSVSQYATSNDEQQVAKYLPNNLDQVEQTNVNEEETKTNLDLFLETNEEQIRFFSTIFDMNYDDVINKIKEINVDADNINANNIGLLKDEGGYVINYQSVDRGILELFLKLEETNPEMITYSYRPCTKNPEYIEALVQYFSSLYNNVDHKLMLSIAAAESGYFTASNMLDKNNIYGGMGSNGLITYKNIEYGVMQYIKKMSEQYYDRGLNTVETIGYVFCPKNVNGVKTVSSHWVNLVNKALAVYNYDIRYVSVAQINDLGNNEI